MISRIFFAIGLGVIAIQAWCVSTTLAQDTRQPESLKITFLVNEGFLIQAGVKSILIDAFVKDEYYGYGALPESAYRRLITGQSPFDNVTLALTSHVHLDHFQTETAVQFLQKNPKSVLMSGEEVVLAIRESDSQPSVANQATIVWPEPGAIKTLEHDGIRIEAFRLRHSGRPDNDVQNLGILLHVGDQSVLHVGDADASGDNFQPYDLARKNIDVAILPMWMFEDRKMVDSQIGAKTYIAAHIPAKELANTKRELGKTQPDVIVLETPMEVWKAK